MQQRCLPLAIVAVFVILATYFSLVVPPWEATDEIGHFEYANFLLVNRRLPLQSLDPAKHETTMAHNPPLYYALLATVLAPFGRSDLARSSAPNQTYVWGNPSSGGYYVALHDRAAEQFPFQGSIRALHAGRLLSVVSGALVVVATYQLGLLLFGAGSPMPLGATMLVAFLPSFLFTSATVHNDSVVSALTAIALWRIFAFVHKPSGVEVVRVAGLLGLATLAKPVAVVLFALLPLALAIVCLRDRRIARAVCWLGLGVVVFLAISGWWLLRNQMLYGDPLGYSVFSQNPIFPRSPRPLTLTTLIGELAEEWSPQSLFFRTLILAFGYMDNHGPDRLYYLAYAVAAIAAIGLLAAAIRWRRHWRVWAPDAVLALVAVALLYSTVIRHALDFAGGAHGRYLFPVLPLLSLGAALGLRGLVPHRLSRQAILLPGAILFLLSVLTPSLIIAPTYTLGNRLSEQQSSSLIANREASFGGLIRLRRAEATPARVEPGGEVTVKLYWQALADVRLSYRAIVEMLSSDFKVAARADRSPAFGKAATHLWRAGDVVSDTFTLRIAEDAPIGIYRVATGFYEMPTLARLPVQGQDAGEGNLATIGQVKVLGLPPTPPGPPLAEFGSQIALVQADLIPQDGQADTLITARLTWLAKAKPNADYTVSLQLLSSAGQVVAQHDSPPRGGAFPTSNWDSGDMIPDTIRIPKPVQPPATLDAYLIIYSRSTGERLLVGNGDAFYLGKLQMR